MKAINTLLVAVALTGLGSCKKFVDIGAPATQLVTQSVFNNNGSANSAQLYIYTQMFGNSESFHMSEYNGMLADELTNVAGNLVPVYTNAMVAANPSGPWGTAYNYIYQENAILSALEGNTALSPAVIQQLKGEALFVRAFWNFYLTNCYGAIPLVTTTDYTVNSVISRSSRSAIYTQIVSDLHVAQGLLNNNFIDASDTTVTKERTRPTAWAATALLARVYLYMGYWTGADSAASAVIGNQAMFHLDSLNGVFRTNSPEAIWELATPLPAHLNTNDGNYYILVSAPNTTSPVSLSPQLLSAFEGGDARRRLWVDSIFTTSGVYYFPYKYKITQATFKSPVTEYTMMFRLAEQYLIRAEARAQENNLTGCAADLDTVRGRAGLGSVLEGSQAQLLATVLHERQVELFTEWGHRWFDLIRTGNANSIMSVVTPLKSGGSVAWNGNDTLYPVPASEISLDDNLSQNTGY